MLSKATLKSFNLILATFTNSKTAIGTKLIFLPKKMKSMRNLPELVTLILATFSCYLFIETQINLSKIDSLGEFSSIDLIVLSFLFSVLIAIIAVIAGVGGGVIFTPILLAFTSIDTLIIRSTGLVVAMFSGLVSTGPLMRRGLADVKLVFFAALPIIIGGMLGSLLAIHLAKSLGETSDGIVRLLLGLLLVFIAILFIFSGKNMEYPAAKPTDHLAMKLKLRHSYWEDSLESKVSYKAVNTKLAMLLFLAVGFTGGFFGLGGGWAVVPVLNLVMSIPLKVSTASSGVLLALGNAAAIWPYINIGALIGVVAAPWMLGQVVGGIIGAHILSSVKASIVRNILITILLASSLKLIGRGIETLTGTNIPFL